MASPSLNESHFCRIVLLVVDQQCFIIAGLHLTVSRWDKAERRQSAGWQTSVRIRGLLDDSTQKEQATNGLT